MNGNGKAPPVALDRPASAIVRDHPFAPSGAWWTLCAVCHLSEAAHIATTLTTGDKR